MEVTLKEGGKSIEGSYMEHPINDTNSPPIRRTDKGRIHSRIPTKDKGFRTKRIASEHLYSKYYTILHIRMAYTVSALYTTFL